MILKPTPQKLDKFFKQHGVKTQMPEGFGGQRHGQPFTTGYYEEYPFIVEYLKGKKPGEIQFRVKRVTETFAKQIFSKEHKKRASELFMDKALDKNRVMVVMAFSPRSAKEKADFIATRVDPKNFPGALQFPKRKEPYTLTYKPWDKVKKWPVGRYVKPQEQRRERRFRKRMKARM
tara:strand:+ start:335 stop:862 length:528 start_codon:yes stop_codon:yes gene_type:complete